MTLILCSVFLLLRVICILQTKLDCASAVCFRDVLAFYSSSKACEFYQATFTAIFHENKDICIINCSLTNANVKKSDVQYEIEEMEVTFSPALQFKMYRPCGSYDNTDAFIKIKCEEKGLNERRVGESCSDSSQCRQGTRYSSCNPTSGVCECEEGYIMMYNICFQGNLSLDDSCDINEQCNGTPEDLFCSQNGSGKICSRTLVSKISSSNNNERNNEDISLFIGLGIGGITFGVLVCGLLYTILVWCKKKADHKRQVYEASTPNYYNLEKRNAGENTEETGKHTSKVSNEIPLGNPFSGQENVNQNDIYNHLNEDNSVPDIASDYDHACFVNQEKNTYNQLGLYNTKRN